MDERELNRLFDKVKNELKSLEIPISDDILGIHVNNRTKKRLGACKIEKRPGKNPLYSIEISRSVLQCTEEQICSVIAHECLHTCPQCFDHGKKWKEYGEKVSQALGYRISRTIETEEMGIKPAPGEEKVKYIVVCQNCGQIYERKRMCPLVRDPAKYRCGKCGMPLANGIKSTTSCR